MIAVIGGTGAQGKGLVARWARAGEEVIIGSRFEEKAKRVAAEVSKCVGKPVMGTTNLEATREADVVVLSVPFEAMRKIMREIRRGLTPGKILLNVVVPIEVRSGEVVFKRPRAGSTGEELAKLVPKGVRVVSAFQTVGAKLLQDLSKPLDCDVVVCGDDPAAKERIMKLVEKMPGARAVDGGPLRNGRFVEPLVALLAELTKRYRVEAVGVRFQGLG
ncbi:MAG: NADPH-dependent F420 reductase [Hadesarchaea archaeon]|nr:NADPH-dependent F420 reductase [Hadesarchaea archaeon]